MHESQDPESKRRDTRLWVRTIDRTSLVLAGISAVVALVLTIQIVSDAAARSFLNRPLPLTLEISSHYWMPLLVFLGLAAAQRNDEHLRVTFILEGMTAQARRVVEIIVMGFSTLLMGYVSYFVVMGAAESTLINETAIEAHGLPIWIARWGAAIGCVALVLQLIATVYRHVVGHPGPGAQAPEPIEAIIVREL